MWWAPYFTLLVIAVSTNVKMRSPPKLGGAVDAAGPVVFVFYFLFVCVWGGGVCGVLVCVCVCVLFWWVFFAVVGFTLILSVSSTSS